MKKKKYSKELESLLAFRIVNAIVASPLLEDEKKLLALEDLRQMYSEDDYYYKCIHLHHYYNNGCDMPESIEGHHWWGASKLGKEFWRKMDAIISKV